MLRKALARFSTLAVALALVLGFSGNAFAISSRTLFAPTGAAVGDLLGNSVASAGDFNGDGYPDVIVGASNASGGAGRAYIYFGGPNADAIPDLTLAGAAGGNFGVSVASAGDFNGDGYADVIVGENLNDVGGVDAGRINIYYGGPNADAAADLTVFGAAAGDNFGISVAPAGDMNGDGYDDVIVGAHLNDAGGGNAGRAYVYYGGPGADAAADLTFTGAAGADFFGHSVASAGDVNGDGYGDVIVGADGNDAGGAEAGRAYVFFGGPGADTLPDMILTGAAAGDQFGLSVSSAGDVNGDGFSDLIVGAPFNDGPAEAGRAYLYYGGPGADFVADMTFANGTINNFLGGSVSSAGDVNGDGYADVIVGAYGNGAGGALAGRAYVYYGGPSIDGVADLTLTGVAAGDIFGAAVASAGDVDGDGHSDVIVGAYQNDAGGANAGRAYVITIYPYQVVSPNGGEQWVAGTEVPLRWRGRDPADLAISFDGGATWSTLLAGVGGADDNELSIVAPTVATSGASVRLTYANQAATRATSDRSDGVFRIVLPVTPPAAAHRLQRTLTGEGVNDGFGLTVASAGDVNGDGFGDVIVGSPSNDAGGLDAGRAYVFYGGPGADAVPDLTLTGAAAGDRFGGSVAAAGDVNGDGYRDVIVGANLNDAGGLNAGRAYVFFGGPGADAVADLTLTGAAASNFFGMAVSSAGDVNGDGFDDVIVGAPFAPTGGRAYVFYGGQSPDAVADVTLLGRGTSLDQFGISVSSAGDVNGDGYGDILVGDFLHDAGGTNAGQAYVYYGGATPDTTPDVTLTGQTAGDNFGFSTSSAGDVNGDGYADVIVGAPSNSAGGLGAGRAYVFCGGPGVDAAPDLTLTGVAPGDNLGTSVSSAGDVNGDGYADVIVGASHNDAGGTDAGRAYVYYGGPGADAQADMMVTGAAAGDQFGGSVSAAGDGLADGYGDLIVGAGGNDAAGTDAGRAYLYDCNRHFVLSPNGGETWNVGATKTVSWAGAEPADLWLSVDGGRTYDLLRTRVGGSENNVLSLFVPHSPTKFARVRVTPSNPAVRGQDESDSTFTIQTSVALLALLAAPAPNGSRGSVISWRTDPGPEDLAGYKVERASSGDGWSQLVALTRETSITDSDGGPGTRYRLFAVNGFGEELLLGETAIAPRVPLAAWPLPYRGGKLSITFATRSGLGGGPGSAEVSLYDASGRLVRTVAKGQFTSGYQSAIWDGRDAQGRTVASGVYFLRATTAGDDRAIKFVVLH
jgi:FG-GAP repeat protein/flagellar hook capping protein FlgD